MFPWRRKKPVNFLFGIRPDDCHNYFHQFYHLPRSVMPSAFMLVLFQYILSRRPFCNFHTNGHRFFPIFLKGLCSVFEPQISRHSTGGSFCLFTFASKRSLSNICQSWGCTFDTKLGTSLFLQGSFMGFLWAATKLPTNC